MIGERLIAMHAAGMRARNTRMDYRPERLRALDEILAKFSKQLYTGYMACGFKVFASPSCGQVLRHLADGDCLNSHMGYDPPLLGVGRSRSPFAFVKEFSDAGETRFGMHAGCMRDVAHQQLVMESEVGNA